MQLEQFNLRNKLAQTQLSPTKCLMPLFEAVANSFNAIQEAREKKGKITITIVREKKQQALSTKVKGKAERLPTHEPVTGFIVEDNGIGFTDANLKSFKEAYSDFKQAAGGKGIGRILWLKAFDVAQVDSVYDNGGKRWRRQFPFALGNDTEPDTKETTNERTTTVELVQYKTDYKKHCPTGFFTIARRIVAHFIESFILDSCPEIWLKDDSNNVSLNRYFKSELRLYAFVICDITPKLEKYMRQHDFVGAADEQTYYKYVGGDYKVYIQVISFDRLLRDSTRRNQAFFDKLRLHIDVQEESVEPPAKAAKGVGAELGETTINASEAQA
jgi:hypothetical protein